MFHCDISFTSKEKATQFGEDAKNFLVSYKDSLNFIREKAYTEQSNEQYIDNAKTIVNNFKFNLITFSKFVGTSNDTTFTPTFSKEDPKFKLAKYTYFLYKEHFADFSKINSFDGINKKLDQVYEVMEKQINI